MKSARFLARRMKLEEENCKETDLYKKYLLDYDEIPSTVFTPLEYSFVGLTE